MSFHGFLNMLKPPGVTSFEVVRGVRRITRERHVGHAGTLDVPAAGVLPICLGQGTRLMELLSQARKRYCVEIVFGAATDTYDASGRVTQVGDTSHLTQEAIVEALQQFEGAVEQRPPMFSALKHQGKRLYELARAGIEVDRPSRRVQIFKLETILWESPLLILRLECGKGTYVRSLVHDLGQALGCGAHINHLVRLQVGPFTIWEAVSLEELEDAFRLGYGQDLFAPLDAVLMDWPAVVVGLAGERALRNGQQISALPGILRYGRYPHQRREYPQGGIQRCRAYSQQGELIALLRREQASWHPHKVFTLR